MIVKSLITAATLILSNSAYAVSIVKAPVQNPALTASEGKVYISGPAVSGKTVGNFLSSVTIHSEIKASFEIDDKGLVRLALPNSGAFLVGAVDKSGAVILDVPFTATAISETYDAAEKSFGMQDVEYITLDIAL